MESLRKRRNHTEETAEAVAAVKAQLDCLQDKRLETKKSVKEWQDKVGAQIENLMIAFHERRKLPREAQGPETSTDKDRRALKAMKQETQRVLSALKLDQSKAAT